MSDFAQYRALTERQRQELYDWSQADPANQQRLVDHNGRADVRDYLDEYSYKWGIAMYLAKDVRCPLADKFWKELKPFEDLEDEMD